MVRVVVQGRFRVYVYAEGGQPHHLPHCNVRWPDGDAQVALDDLSGSRAVRCHRGRGFWWHSIGGKLSQPGTR
jgi:hypothetical protein